MSPLAKLIVVVTQVRFNTKAEWREAVPNLAYFIHHGDWGAPKKVVSSSDTIPCRLICRDPPSISLVQLRALLVVCPPSENTIVRGKAPLPDVKSQNWIAMFRPEARLEGKAIPVRYASSQFFAASTSILTSLSHSSTENPSTKLMRTSFQLL